MTATPAYAALKASRTRIYNLEHLQAIASWDRMTNMPAGGAAARAAAQGELAALLQRLQTDPEVAGLLAAAAAEALEGDDARNFALMQREAQTAAALPEALQQRRTLRVGAAAAAWSRARAGNDWAVFAEVLTPLVETVREGAERLGDTLGIGPYDALLDSHDRGLRHARVEALFADVAGWLPDLTRRIVDRQASDPAIAPVGPFDVAGQRHVCLQAMASLGFDSASGRLDISAHPFTGGVPEDVRITTRYRTDECLGALMGVIHETGHARYQAGLPRAWLGQPLGEPCSAAMHEAQALSFERQLAPTATFAARLSPLLTETFGAQAAFAPDALLRLMTRVRPGRIRVEADEVTYPAHVMLRVDIEAALIAGEISVADIPAWWDERMERLLGIDTRGDFANGPLQDIHWSQGMFGYFPAYLLGAMIAAQLAEGWRAAFDASADPATCGDWLAANIWCEGARFTTDELVTRATGRPLSADALRAHLESRYLP